MPRARTANRTRRSQGLGGPALEVVAYAVLWRLEVGSSYPIILFPPSGKMQTNLVRPRAGLLLPLAVPPRHNRHLSQNFVGEVKFSSETKLLPGDGRA